MRRQRYHKLRNNKEKVIKGSKRSLFFLGFLTIVFLVIIVGISYAIFTTTLRGERNVSVKAGTLAVEFKDKNVITLENAYPMTDSRGMTTNPYEFTIENTGDIKAIYDISLENDTNNTLNHSNIKYAIKKGEGAWSEPRVLDSLSLEKDISIEPGVKESYQLRLWLDEKAGNESQGKVFKTRIVVSSTQESGKKEDVTAPTITLAGDLSINVEQNGSFLDPGVESVRDDKDSLNKEDVTLSYEYYDGSEVVEVETIDTTHRGIYYVYYKISDKSGNEAVVIRSVNVYKKDTTPPSIRLNGKSKITLEKDESYEEQGATAEDIEEGDLTNRVVIVGKVNTKRVGTYTIKYLITDQEGNTASIVRVVNVVKIASNIREEIILDLDKNPTEDVKITGENLGSITYKSEDEEVATVDENGKVTGKVPGETIITIITSSGLEEQIRVYVQRTVGVTYVKQGTGVSSIGKTNDSCIITSGTSCTVVAPEITVASGYTAIGWNVNQEGTTGTAVGKTISLTSNSTYYSISSKNAITYKVNFNANGNTVAATSKSCQIAAVYNNATQATSCSITTPVITAPTSTPTVVGYNQTASATSSQVGSNTTLTVNATNNGKTYYAITRKAAKTVTITFNKNGAASQTDASGSASTATTVTRSCTIAAAYNGKTQATTCNVTSPKIAASTNTPTITGYSAAAGTHSNAWSQSTAKAVSANATYYAQTTKAAVTRKATYTKNGGVSAIGKTSDSCTIAATYNGTAQATSCKVTLPSITKLAGYNTGFWSTSTTATSGTAAGTAVSLSGNVTYYAKARDTTKPVWTVVSTSPSSGNMSSSSSARMTITFKGTDTSGSVTSTLTAANITVKAGSTTVTPSTKTLSAATSVTNGKQYTLTLGGISVDGAISITIAANTLKDGSGNANAASTITTSVVVNTVSISKATVRGGSITLGKTLAKVGDTVSYTTTPTSGFSYAGATVVCSNGTKTTLNSSTKSFKTTSTCKTPTVYPSWKRNDYTIWGGSSGSINNTGGVGNHLWDGSIDINYYGDTNHLRFQSHGGATGQASTGNSYTLKDFNTLSCTYNCGVCPSDNCSFRMGILSDRSQWITSNSYSSAYSWKNPNVLNGTATFNISGFNGAYAVGVKMFVSAGDGHCIFNTMKLTGGKTYGYGNTGV